MSRKRRGEYWVGRLVTEIATASASLELGQVDQAREGLKETLNEYLRDNHDPEISSFVAEIRRERMMRTTPLVEKAPLPPEAVPVARRIETQDTSDRVSWEDISDVL